MSKYKLHLYWNGHTPNEVVEATEDDVRHLLHVGLAEPVEDEEVKPDATDSDAGRRSDGDDVPTEPDNGPDS